ncbi:ABC transporter substrate-binding protein [Actinokineospora xionganensis]|uniref:Extracellular solute-binding protein n=1 Tax=Actinokineospora xionganensis TaxID=2684470 RepID=A0ABR7L4G5_9PSEU|nr:extracellular solute-binding protein [Actinokineospora xionganensis]MBC6447319.1 extracellular solute-binding protein [Actinokineospora xionganensis]
MTRTGRLRRSISFAALGLSALLAVSACGSPSGPGDSAASGEFTYWSMWQEKEPQAQVIKAAIDSFTKDTGIKVDVQWHGREVMKKLTPSLRTKAAADLVDQSMNQLGNGLSNTGQSADLTSVYNLEVPGEGKKVSDVIPSKYVDYLKDKEGKPFMVPYEVTGEGLWFNAKQLPTEQPQTWDDLVKLLDAAKAKGVSPLALDADNTGVAKYWPLLTLIRAVGPEGMQKLASDRTGAAWDDPNVLDAVTRVEKLVKGGYFAPGYNSGQYPAQQNLWAQNKAAYILQGSWVTSETKTYAAQGFEYSSVQLPPINGGTDAVGVNFFGFGIPKTAANGEAAGKFIAYFLNKSRLEGISTKADNITPRADIPAPAALESLSKSFQEKAVYPSGAALGLKFGGWESTAFQPVAQSLVQGKTSAADFVSQVKAKSIEFWKTQG